MKLIRAGVAHLSRTCWRPEDSSFPLTTRQLNLNQSRWPSVTAIESESEMVMVRFVLAMRLDLEELGSLDEERRIASSSSGEVDQNLEMEIEGDKCKAVPFHSNQMNLFSN